MKPWRVMNTLFAIATLVWAHAWAGEIERPHSGPKFIPPEPRTETLTLEQYGKGVGLAALSTVGPMLLGYSVFKLGVREWEEPAAWAIAAGFLAGPSAGQVYHGYYGHALAATSLRILGSGIVLVTVISAVGDVLGRMDCIPDESSPSCDSEPSDTEGGIAFGITVYALGVTYSLVQPLLRVRLANRVGEENGSSRQPRISFLPQTLTPVFIPESAGRMKTGLVADWVF